MIGSVKFNSEIDNTFMHEVISFVKQGGEYRMLPFKAPAQGFVDFCNDDKLFYPEMSASSELPLPVPNPLPSVN